MSAPIRFSPADCPACKARLEPKYSQYRHAPQHPLYWVMVVLGVIAVLVLLWFSFNTAAYLALDVHDGAKKQERGMIFFLAFIIDLPIVFGMWRLWLKLVQRLPRIFVYKCEKCPWSGPVSVTDMSDPGDYLKARDLAAPIEQVGQVAVQVVAPGVVQMPGGPPDALDARRERRQEQERRRARTAEHEAAPNPDFDFRDK